MIVISHGNGIETYYGHCSKLYAEVGEKVSQGEAGGCHHLFEGCHGQGY